MKEDWTYRSSRELQQAIEARLQRLGSESVAQRIWEHDAALWSSDPHHQAVVRNRLGWLHVAESMQKELDPLNRFVDRLVAEGYRHALLLGMGGSSLCPEVLSRVFGPRAGYLELRVLDSTDPAAVQSFEKELDLDKTIFIVSSKSGTTIEVQSFYRYFRSKVPQGEQFVAITDSGTPLERLAKESGFRRTFRNPADIGGRYSALSYFGLLPAALLGMDLGKFLERASRMVQACSLSAVEENPGLWLGAVLGEAALAGKHHLTLVISPEIAPLGSWIEQLIAESTGKEGKGIVPIDGEPVGDPVLYDSSRIFVYLRYKKTGSTYLDEKMKALADAGQTVVQIDLEDIYDLAGEFFLWEMAVAVAGMILGIDPFDEPNVKESKDITSELLKKFENGERFEEDTPLVEEEGLSIFTDGGLRLKPGRTTTVREVLASHLSRLEPGDFVGWLLYMHHTEETDRIIDSMRRGVLNVLRVATTVGYGPRFLHSTGQLYKGGLNKGVFVQVTCDDPTDVLIPGARYSFGVLKVAQALGDFIALNRHGRRVIRCHLGGDPLAGLKKLSDHFDAIL